jgi:hypothetical protein
MPGYEEKRYRQTDKYGRFRKVFITHARDWITRAKRGRIIWAEMQPQMHEKMIA